MTVAHHRKPVSVATLADAEAVIRNRGLRVSTARRLLLEVLLSADRPVSAEELAGGLEGALPGGDLPSVYRNLETLEQLGLVHHMHLGHGPGLYELAGRSAAREYLVCDRCRAVTAVEASELDDVRAEIERRFMFAARFDHFPVVGLCHKCRDVEE